jgi:hypothetical protein
MYFAVNFFDGFVTIYMYQPLRRKQMICLMPLVLAAVPLIAVAIVVLAMCVVA